MLPFYCVYIEELEVFIYCTQRIFFADCIDCWDADSWDERHPLCGAEL